MSTACYQLYTLNVASQTQAWWAMEGPSPVSQPDALTGPALAIDAGNPAHFSVVPGHVADAEQIAPVGAVADRLCTGFDALLKFSGNGTTIVFWVNFTDIVPTPNSSFVLVSYNFDQNAVYHTLAVSRGVTPPAASWHVFFDGVPLITRAAAVGWHFLVVTFNQSTGNVGFDIDQAGTTLAFSGFLAAGPNTDGNLCLGATTLIAATELSVIFDEVAIFDRILSVAQLNYLYNAGAGRTWPVTLP